MSDTIATIPSTHRARLDALRVLPYAIQSLAGASRAADDLAFCQSIRLAVERAKAETLGPLRARLDVLRGQYDAALETVRTAEARVKDALLAWRVMERDTRERAAQEAAAAQAALVAEQARQDAVDAGLSRDAAAELSAGVAASVQAEVTASIAPAPVPPVVAGEAGTASVRVTWEFTVVNATQVPRDYLKVDEVAIREAIRHGLRELPGVHIFPRESIVGSRGRSGR